MIIKYVHISEPEVEKFFDTEKAYKNPPVVFGTQKGFDVFTLQLFERDKKKGLVLSYEVLKE